MRILALTHGPRVRAELFGEVARGQGHELVEWELPAQGPPPDGFDAVMVFGGRMNVGEEARHPWLEVEYELLRSWVGAGTPLLGVCLGGQTLAHALGGRVGPAPDWKAGFYDVELTAAGRDDPVLGALPERFEALLANRYEFDPPPGAARLARAGPQEQAFRVGERAWGVQFHPEARRDQVLSWWADGRELPAPLGELAGLLDAKLPPWQELGRRLCLAFLAAARS
ncbi:MAG TPA: type 1 glutamine amidotransferase [Gaiellaceae bacterium]|nr:type 1 glutamine amidotransferase [Gaiellaceae bacterium]